MGMHPAAMPTTMEMTIWKNFMTMPTTAMGIWAYCACPNTGSRAPYFRSILLMAAMAATRLIWERKLVMPSVSIREQSLPWSGRSRRPGRIIFIRGRYQTASPAVITCPITVATAAPIMPQRQTKMKMGSRRIFTTAPASVDIMAKRGAPPARMTGFMACPNI